MATVTYIRERKQTPSVMAAVIAYCSQELKTVAGKAAGISPASTAPVTTL